MTVTVDEREYVLYLGFTPSDGGNKAQWTMHTGDAFRGGAWLWTDYDVSNDNPFASIVSYDKE